MLGKTKNGRNILHIAAANGKNKCIEALLKLDIGENLNLKLVTSPVAIRNNSCNFCKTMVVSDLFKFLIEGL